MDVNEWKMSDDSHKEKFFSGTKGELAIVTLSIAVVVSLILNGPIIPTAVLASCLILCGIREFCDAKRLSIKWVILAVSGPIISFLLEMSVSGIASIIGFCGTAVSIVIAFKSLTVPAWLMILSLIAFHWKLIMS